MLWNSSAPSVVRNVVICLHKHAYCCYNMAHMYTYTNVHHPVHNAPNVIPTLYLFVAGSAGVSVLGDAIREYSKYFSSPSIRYIVQYLCKFFSHNIPTCMLCNVYVCVQLFSSQVSTNCSALDYHCDWSHDQVGHTHPPESGIHACTPCILQYLYPYKAQIY